VVTKEQAMQATRFLQIESALPIGSPKFVNGRVIQEYDLTKTKHNTKPYKWRASGKCKTWKTQPERFQLPIKFGMYTHDYLTNENCHLFEVEP
jgi:hypothetical protein